MNIFITLDYELFFGSKLGSVSDSIIKPTKRLIEIAKKQNIKMTFFIDVGYIIKLKKYKAEHMELEQDYTLIEEQIETLVSFGHDIQLHIHPHWEDSYYDGLKWVIITKRYKLHDFSSDEIKDIVFRYKKTLEEITNRKVFVYRAGGWCIQPFLKIKPALQENELWLDSTLYNNGSVQSGTHFSNFKNMPKKSCYRFEDDPLVETADGYFMEIPVSSYKVSPLFHLKTYLLKKLGVEEHKTYGNGIGLPSGSLWDKFKILIYLTSSPVSIDGYKSILLQKLLDSFQNTNREKEANFVLIGHNKLLSKFSLDNLEEFIQKNNSKHKFTTYSIEFSSLLEPEG